MNLNTANTSSSNSMGHIVSPGHVNAATSIPPQSGSGSMVQVGTGPKPPTQKLNPIPSPKPPLANSQSKGGPVSATVPFVSVPIGNQNNNQGPKSFPFKKKKKTWIQNNNGNHNKNKGKTSPQISALEAENLTLKSQLAQMHQQSQIGTYQAGNGVVNPTLSGSLLRPQQEHPTYSNLLQGDSSSSDPTDNSGDKGISVPIHPHGDGKCLAGSSHDVSGNPQADLDVTNKETSLLLSPGTSAALAKRMKNLDKGHPFLEERLRLAALDGASATVESLMRRIINNLVESERNAVPTNENNVEGPAVNSVPVANQMASEAVGEPGIANLVPEPSSEDAPDEDLLDD